jgi:hypothetical protein
MAQEITGKDKVSLYDHHGPSNHPCFQGSQIHAVRRLASTIPCHHKTHSSRESDDHSFDWFKPYSDISHIVHELIPDKSAQILVLGCGNSRLSEDVSHSRPQSDLSLSIPPYMQMYDDGYKSITNVDVRSPQYALLNRLKVSSSVLFRGHRPNATTPQRLAAANEMLVAACLHARGLLALRRGGGGRPEITFRCWHIRRRL